MTGATKIIAITIFATNVATVASQISLVGPLFFDSSDTWMPRVSDMASAIAMVTMPPIATVREWMPEWRPTINPYVVITPDVRAKLRPVLNEVFIINLHCGYNSTP